jgi:DNA (cytosine-5)-methyltransferase 1
LDHYDDGWDFIWSSPPCPTHSRIRNIAGVGCGQNKPVYPDMKLYEEIIFLQQIYNSSGCLFNGRYCVENVASYYSPLIPPLYIGRHYFWANYHVTPFRVDTRGHMEDNNTLMEIKGFNVNDKTLLRNCTEPELGLHIFNCAFKLKQERII